MIVSPFARPDYVLHDVLDHTSILKLIEEKWNLPPLTHRDAAAVSPLGALDLGAPPFFLTPPQLATPAAGTRRPIRVDVGPLFSVTSPLELGRALIWLAVVWAIGFLAYGGTSFWFQSIVLLALTGLVIQGVRDSGFWRQWIFWRPPRYPGLIAVYNAVFAFVTLSTFGALLSSEFYRYGIFRVSELRLSGNLFWINSVNYFWNLVDAVPGLQISETLRWDSPLHFSNIWAELFIILFRLMVLGPFLSVVAQAIQAGSRRTENPTDNAMPR